MMMCIADIGTATNQWDDKNGNDGPDVCQGNVVMDNYIDTQVPFAYLYSSKQPRRSGART